MDKSEVIRVRISASTLVLARAKTRLSGESISGYVRRLIMLDLGGDVEVEKKIEPTVSKEDAGFVHGVLLEGDERDAALEKLGWRDKMKDKK